MITFPLHLAYHWANRLHYAPSHPPKHLLSRTTTGNCVEHRILNHRPWLGHYIAYWLGLPSHAADCFCQLPFWQCAVTTYNTQFARLDNCKMLTLFQANSIQAVFFGLGKISTAAFCTTASNGTTNLVIESSSRTLGCYFIQMITTVLWTILYFNATLTLN